MSEDFHRAVVEAKEQRKRALIRATREDLLECVQLLETTLVLCRTLENNGFPHAVSQHAKQIRERIETLQRTSHDPH